MDEPLPEGVAGHAAMVRLAALTRESFAAGDLSLMLSPRTVLTWAQNAALFAHDVRFAFEVTFAERIEPDERRQLDEMYQRCFG
jgi:cobaltochelatase CobS